MTSRGLGAKQIEMFFNDADLPVKTPADIFTLAARDEANPLKKLKNRDGFGEISVTKLFAAIEAKRRIPLDRLIFALGHPPCRRGRRRSAGAALWHLGGVRGGDDPGADRAAPEWAELTAIDGVGEVLAASLVGGVPEPGGTRGD